MATAKKEPHRPDEFDLFINYEDQYKNLNQNFPPSYVPPSSWPQILPRAKSFSSSHPNTRFALLRLWSAPHYHPLMVGPYNRPMTSFLDSMNRSWFFKFVPKDMPGSEFSAHHTAEKRLDLIRHKIGDRAMIRGGLILVMGEDEKDLFKYSTAATFALQTKPWLREVDLWKSFINVDLEFIEGLDDHWLD
jgi:hypothetical protein